MARKLLWKRVIFSGLGILAAASIFFFLVAAIRRAAPAPPPDCTRASVFCVGLVTGVGGVEDGGLNQQTWDGIRRSKVADWVQYIETVDSKDYSKNIAFFAEAGYDVIVTVGGGAGEITVKSAEKYSETYFIGVDQYQGVARDNLAGLIFPEDQAGFLAGALAAQMTQTGQVGAVCSTPDIPTYWRYCEGFKAGVAYIDAEIQVTVAYSDNYSLERALDDPLWAAEATREMIAGGVDVIFADPTATGLAALEEAAQERIYVIGSGVDQYDRLPETRPYLLTSVMPLVMRGSLDLIRFANAAQAGSRQFPAGNYTGDIGYAPFRDLQDAVPHEAQMTMAEIRLELMDGRLNTGVPAEQP